MNIKSSIQPQDEGAEAKLIREAKEAQAAKDRARSEAFNRVSEPKPKAKAKPPDAPQVQAPAKQPENIPPSPEVVSRKPRRNIPLIDNTKLPAVPWKEIKDGDYPATGNHGIALDDDDLVLDFDPRNYAPGENPYIDLLDLPVTTLVRSGNGFHRYFKKPPDIKLKKHQSQFPGVDFLSAGCFVVGVGSVVDNKPYKLLNDYPVADIPLDFLETLEKQTDANREGTGEETLLLLYKFQDLCKTTDHAVKGSRGISAYKLACRGRDFGLPAEKALDEMNVYWNPRCLPPLTDAELKIQVAHAYEYAKNALGCDTPEAVFKGIEDKPLVKVAKPPAEPKPSAGDKVRATMPAENVKFWHDATGTGYATVWINGHHEHYATKSEEFQLLVERNCRMRMGKSPTESALKDAIRGMDSEARFSDKVYKVGLRRMRDDDGNIWIDLCDSAWRAIKVTNEGWEIVDHPSVSFIRNSQMLPLPVPESVGVEVFNELRELLNFADVYSWALFLCFLVICLVANVPAPVFMLRGPQGYIKTTLLRVIRSLVDPNASVDSGPPENIKDLMIRAALGAVYSGDNFSKLLPWLMDALCRLCTGGSISSRTLYQDKAQTAWHVQCPVVITCIGIAALQDDLSERVIAPALRYVPEEARLTEDEFWSRFNALRPRVLGALLSALSGAMLRLPEALQTKYKPRMADFFCWSIAAEPDLGVPIGTFETAFRAGRKDSAELTVEGSHVAGYISKLPLKEPLEITADALLSAVKNTTNYADHRYLPPNARSLSVHLTKHQVALLELGIRVTQLPRKSKQRLILIEALETRDPPDAVMDDPLQEKTQTEWEARANSLLKKAQNGKIDKRQFKEDWGKLGDGMVDIAAKSAQGFAPSAEISMEGAQ